MERSGEEWRGPPLHCVGLMKEADVVGGIPNLCMQLWSKRPDPRYGQQKALRTALTQY